MARREDTNAGKEAILLFPVNAPRWVLREAYALVESAGYSLVDVLKYRRHPSKTISDYKLRELRELVDSTEFHGKIIVYDQLKPSTFTRFITSVKREVIDRVMLILEIFAQHAGSREAKLQIELAEIKHRLPLVREAIRQAKMRELPGFLGPGSYAINSYYRFLVSRASRIRRELEELRLRRKRERERRRKMGFIHIAIIGYASAGKTSLFNTLTKLSKPVGKEYFTTLTPKRSSIVVRNKKVVLIDTVGFISDIPIELIEAFHATLEEVALADMELFVVDASEEGSVVKWKIREGIEILKRIGAIGKPMLLVFNKVDLNYDKELLESVSDYAAKLYPTLQGRVFISAKNNINIDKVVSWLENQVARTEKYMF